LGAAVNRAKYFIDFNAGNAFLKYLTDKNFRKLLIGGSSSKFHNQFSQQLTYFSLNINDTNIFHGLLQINKAKKPIFRIAKHLIVRFLNTL
jgi:hypothetical protein